MEFEEVTVQNNKKEQFLIKKLKLEYRQSIEKLTFRGISPPTSEFKLIQLILKNIFFFHYPGHLGCHLIKFTSKYLYAIYRLSIKKKKKKKKLIFFFYF